MLAVVVVVVLAVAGVGAGVEVAVNIDILADVGFRVSLYHTESAWSNQPRLCVSQLNKSLHLIRFPTIYSLCVLANAFDLTCAYRSV